MWNKFVLLVLLVTLSSCSIFIYITTGLAHTSNSDPLYWTRSLHSSYAFRLGAPTTGNSHDVTSSYYNNHHPTTERWALTNQREFTPNHAHSTATKTVTTVPWKAAKLEDQTVSISHNQQSLTIPLPSSILTGYVLAESYWEQQTSGCRNLQNLQCWASKHNMKVVEPIVEKSLLHTPFMTVKHGTIKFSDMFDIESWNRESSQEKGNAELVPWDVFLRQAPRSVITVQLRYIQKKKLKNSTNTDNFRYKTGCPGMRIWPTEKQLATFVKHNFEIVKRVCLNFEYGDKLSLETFQKEIFGDYSPRNVTVFFRQWRGLGPGRISVKDGGCSNNGIQEHMQVSHRIQRDSKSYIQNYLVNDGQTHLVGDHRKTGYVAIMARLEKSKISFAGERKGIVPYCFGQILEYHRRVVAESGFDRTFLAIDVGKYGSHSFRNTGDSSDLNEEFQKFFIELYRDELSIPAWENTFKSTGHTSDPGYIALLQKVIVTKANCVIFVGGGSFQKHALYIYQSTHSMEEWCIHIIHECTTEKNLPFSQ